MKRIFTLLLALVMVLSLAAPALAAEDLFEAFEGEVAAPEAPEAPVEEAPRAEAPALEPALPQPAAAEPGDTAPEDTEPAPDDAQTGKLTILGDTSKLWLVLVVKDTDTFADRKTYTDDFGDIPLQTGDMVALAMDYRYTAQFDADLTSASGRGVLNGEFMSGTAHDGDIGNAVVFYLNAGDSCDVTATIVEDPEAPDAIPVTVTAPEGVYVKTNEFALLDPDFSGTFTCDAGYVPFFDGAEPQYPRETDDGYVLTSFEPYDDVESIHVDVKKATGNLNLTDPEDKVVYAFMYDDNDAEADAGGGIVGGMALAVQVEAGYSVKADLEPFAEDYFAYEGENLHGYYYVVPDSGDINVEVVKTDLPVAAPVSGSGWACDETTGDCYYFVDGVQKFDYWAGSQRGLWYYVGSDGKLATGFQYVENSNGTGWYMFQTDNANGCIGRMLTGWQWTYSDAGMGWFNTAHGGVNGQCTYTTEWGAYNAATGMWADGGLHWF